MFFKAIDWNIQKGTIGVDKKLMGSAAAIKQGYLIYTGTKLKNV